MIPFDERRKKEWGKGEERRKRIIKELRSMQRDASSDGADRFPEVQGGACFQGIKCVFVFSFGEEPKPLKITQRLASSVLSV